MKKCPKCLGQWPDAANFCPKDGTRTVLVTEEEAKAAAAAPAASAGAPAEESGKAGAEGGGAEQDGEHPTSERKGFSETQWFMAAQSPELLKEEATADELMDMQQKYKRDETIASEDRKKFSLRKGSGKGKTPRE